MADYECLGLNVIGVDASEKFFTELAGVTEPERKRKIIGKGFIKEAGDQSCLQPQTSTTKFFKI